MTYVSCADGEWLSGVQLSPDGAENNIEVVNEVPVAWKYQVDGDGQGDIRSLAIHGIVNAHLHGLLPEIFVLTIVLGAFSIARRFHICATLLHENIHRVIMVHRTRPADELANAFHHALNLPLLESRALTELAQQTARRSAPYLDFDGSGRLSGTPGRKRRTGVYPVTLRRMELTGRSSAESLGCISLADRLDDVRDPALGLVMAELESRNELSYARDIFG
jgi:hypothetical protein